MKKRFEYTGDDPVVNPVRPRVIDPYAVLAKAASEQDGRRWVADPAGRELETLDRLQEALSWPQNS